MSIESPVGTLDIKNATLRVGKLEVSNIQGIDTALNVTRANSVLIYDDQASTTTFNGTTSSAGVRDTVNGYLDVSTGYVYWGQKLPNSWVMDFEMDIRSGTNAGSLYANVFSTTNTGGDGYSFTFNDSNDKITLKYDGTTLTESTVSGLFTASESWQKVVINYERGLIAISVGGSRKFYYKDIERETPYTTGEYISFSSASTDGRKIRDLRIVNGEKWVYAGESNVVYTQGSVGVGVTDPTTALDVSGTVKATALEGDGSAITNISSANVGDFASNVTRIETLETDLSSNATRVSTLETDLSSNATRVSTLETDLSSNATRVSTLETDLGSNVTRIETLETDLGSNVTRIGTLETGNMTISGQKTFSGDVILQSNLHVQGDLLVANTVNMTVSDPILELGSNNLNTGDIGIVMTRHGAANSNVTVFFDETEDVLKLGYTLNGANDTTLEFDSNALAVSVQGALTAASVSGDGSGLSSIQSSNVSDFASNVTRITNLESSDMTIGGEKTFSSNLQIGTANLFVDTTTGRVGIGTTSPAFKLDVHGTSNVGALTATSGTFSGALVINGGPENDTTPALTIGGGLFDESDLYVLNTYNVNTGVGYAAKVLGVNIKNKVETDNSIQIRQNTGGVTSAGAIYLGSDDVNQGIFGVLGGTGVAGSTLGEYLTVKANGNVGIGTNSPSHKLNVRATSGDAEVHIQAQGNDGGDAILYFNGANADQRKCAIISSNVAPNSWCKQDLYFCHNTDSNSDDVTIADSKMVITNNGNVGIGTSGPESGLHIYGTDNPLAIQSQRSPYPKLSFDWSGSNAENFQFYDHHGSGRGFLYGRRYTTGTSANPYAGWHFYGNGNTLGVRIDGSGNVGIGIESPVYTLDVNGVSRSRGVCVNSGFSNNTARPALSTGSTHPSYEIRSIGGNGNVGSAGGDDGFLRLRAGGGTGTNSASYIDLSGYSVYSGNDMKRNIVFGTFGTERMRILENGNVGIGNSTPSYKLDVAGSFRVSGGNTSTFGNDGLLHINSRSTTYGSETVALQTTIDSRALTAAYPGTYGGESRNVLALQPDGGYVGIGTTSPKAVAHVGKLSANSGTFNDIPQSNMGISATFPDSTRLWLANRLSATGEDYWGMALGTKYTGDIYIQSVNKDSTAVYDLLLQPNGGNVGIGTTSPDAKLYVVTSSSTPALYLRNSTNAAGCKLVMTDQGSALQRCTLTYFHGDGSSLGAENRLHFSTTEALSVFSTEGTLMIGVDGKDNGAMGSGNTVGRKNLFIQSTYNGNTSQNYGWWIGAQNQAPSASDNDLYFGVVRNGTLTVPALIQDNQSQATMNFTGQHRTFVKGVPIQQLEDKEGLIVSADQNDFIRMSGGVARGNEAITTNESLPIVSFSTKSNDKKCFGVISTTEDPENRVEVYGNFASNMHKELGDTRVYINSVGEGAIWVTDINGPLESGDYITTSNVAGYGMRQEDDILHNYTVAKITMDCDFNPRTQPKKIIKKELANVDYWIDYATSEIKQEEYETLPENEREIREDKYYKIYKREIQKTNPENDKFVHEVQEELVNVLDAHGQLQWEDDPSGATEKAYKIRYLTADGTQTDEANAVHTAAFVGCTYHCG